MLDGLFSDEAGIPTQACLTSGFVFLNITSACHQTVQSEAGGPVGHVVEGLLQ